MPFITELIVIGICLSLNALLACFEMAFVTVTKAQLRKLIKAGNKAAELVLVLRQQPERTLSVIQIGITLVGMISAAVGGASAEESFSPYIQAYFAIPENWAEGIAIAIIVIPLTLVNVVIGELVPKTIALRNPIPIVTWGAYWILWADRIFSPVATMLEWTTKVILLPFRKNKPPALAEPGASIEMDNLSMQTQQYMLNLVNIETKRARDAMVDWDSVNRLDENDSKDAVITAVLASGHTRLPVTREGDVIGLLHTKEFITMLSASMTEGWKHLIRPTIFIRDNEPVLKGLRVMQERRSHMAIVIDKNKRPIGIMTLEDVIEEIVGDLYDEDDDGRIRRLLSLESKWRARRR